MKLSIVTTLYKSAPHVKEFYNRITTVASQFAQGDYEIIFVNDGSPDSSLDLLLAEMAGDSHVLILDLSRNFGHHKAMMTGLRKATGDLVFLIDSDLEEEPEWLPLFSNQMNEERSDVVYGIQEHRRGGLFEKVSGYLFYSLFRVFTGIEQPNNIVTARLMTQRYVQALIAHEERELNIGGLWIITGFKQSPRPIYKCASSTTTYTFAHKVNHFVTAITSFSSLPLIFTFYSGLLVSISAVLYIGYLVARYFWISAPPDGYTSLIASIWLFSGLIILFLGVQGIYISKLFTEVKRRPYTIIRQVFRGGKEMS